MKKLIEGVRYNKEKDFFDFDWKNDLKGDFIDLKFKTYNKVLSSKQGYDLYYAYKINKDVNKDLKKELIASIKYIDPSKVKESDLELMISKSIINFDQTIDNLSSYDVIVFPKSSSNILQLLKSKLSAKVGNSAMIVSDLFVKNTLENIKYNEEKLSKLSKEEREKTIKILDKLFSKDDYKLRSIPPRYRKFIDNFISFDSEASRSVFNKITEGKVLVVDDILTEGTTFINMCKLLVNSGAEKVVGFVLISMR